MKMKLTIDLQELKISRVVKFLVAADLLCLGGWGLIGPLFAIFIFDTIPQASMLIVGGATAIYWISKSVMQLPVAIFLDRIMGEKDDFYALLISLILSGFVAMAFLLVKTVGGLFFVSFLQGIAFAFYTPSWSGIFSRHLDKEHYAYEWSLDSTTIGIAYGITALLGGVIAQYFGFQAVYIMVALLSFSAAILLFSVPNLVFPKGSSRKPLIRDHTPMNINR
ncbi:MAG: MFS transporter [Candidatus Paceibacterota bacterium]|jgi:MFS family permease